MSRAKYVVVQLCLLACAPLTAKCQIFSGEMKKFQYLLDALYKDMLPLSSDLLTVAQAIGAFGALWYIGYRIWKSLAAAEPIDFFSLLRPLVIAIIITLYPYVLGIMNGILSPTVIATEAMVMKSGNPVQMLLKDREEAITNSEEWQDLVGLHGSQEDWRKYEQEEDKPEGLTLGRALSFSLSIVTNSLNVLTKLIFSFLLQLLYFAAAICIDAIRTFILL